MNKMDHKPRPLGPFLLPCLFALLVFSSCSTMESSNPAQAAIAEEKEDDIIVAEDKPGNIETGSKPEIVPSAGAGKENLKTVDIEPPVSETDENGSAEGTENEEMSSEKGSDETEPEDIKDKEDTDNKTGDNEETEETKDDSDMKPEEENAAGNEEQTVAEEAEQQTNGFSKSEITDDVKQRITGLSYSADCTVPYEDLRYLRVMYVDFSGSDRVGEIVCNKAIADDLLEIFKGLYDARYQIDKIRLIDEYGADDDLSCADDNTSCFCFRKVYGSKNLSKHALGMAVDINPFYNPYVTYPNGNIRISPPGSEPYADRNADFPHKIDKNDLAYKLFKAHGFKWGGDWNSLKDYQHFQKG